MFDHVTIRVGDQTESERFYDSVLTPLGIDQTYRTGTASEWQDHRPPVDPRGRPRCRQALLRDDRAATKAGFTSHGAPGERARHHPGYYAAYVLDPDGTNVEVVNHHRA